MDRVSETLLDSETGEFRLKIYQQAIRSLNLSPADNRKKYCDNAKDLINLG